jgi:hypothetical protein
MSIHRRAGSIFWPLLLIVIGGLLLARNIGYSIPFWTVMVRYWPVLIIVWGFLKIVDYYRMRRTGDNSPLFSGGEVALLIFVILAGSAITTAANASPDVGAAFRIGDFDLWDITGNNFEYSEHHEVDVPAGSTIEINNRFGSVDVRPAETDRIILDVKKTVRASSKEEADRLSEQFVFAIAKDDSQYRIASNQDASRGRQRFKSSLTILVPKQSLIRLDNRFGRITLQGLTGNQSISNRYGEINVRGIDGNVEVSNAFGAITAEDIRGSMTVSNRYGEVRLRFEGPPQNDISVTAQFSDVRLDLPSSSAFSFQARTAFADVESDFEGLTRDRSNREESLGGQVGQGGPQISISSRFGNIRLRKR